MIDAVRRLPPIPGLSGVQPAQPTTPAAQTGRTQTGNLANRFGELLNQELQPKTELNFSQHAQARLLSRQIQLTPQQMDRLQSGVSQAAQKGAKESLVMVDQLAFIVSVPNRTVVTAVDGAPKNGNVFTQIDSAVIV